MVLIELAGLAFVGIVLGVLGYLLGRFTGIRAERQRWQRRIAGEVHNLARTRAIIRHALEKRASPEAAAPPASLT